MNPRLPVGEREPSGVDPDLASPSLEAWIPLALIAFTVIVDAVVIPAAFLGHWFNAGRPDFFLMADSFLHGHLWLDVDWGPPINDLIILGGHVYVPFQPFPAFLLVPLVALIGVGRAITIEPLINAVLTGVDVALVWILLGRLGVRRIEPRIWLVALFGFGTVLWNITVRGGVWHTAEIVAIGLTLLALVESRADEPRGWVLGLLGGAAFLTRSTLLFALPYYAWVVAGRPADLRSIVRALRDRIPAVLRVVLATTPFFAAFAWYNWARFGSPFETGYGMATLPAFLEAQREQGLFSIVHLPMNIDYLLLKGPDALYPYPPFFEPSPLGMSVLLTSPALVVGLRALFSRAGEAMAGMRGPAGPSPQAGATWRAGGTAAALPLRPGLAATPRTGLPARPRGAAPGSAADAWAVALTGLLVLTPTMLYYGGGWVQFGFRYLLDSVPFWFLLCGFWAARRGVGLVWQLAIGWSILINMVLAYWALNM